MPDGTVVGFPDDMPPEQIKNLIATKFPDAVPPSPVAQQTARELSAITRSFDKPMDDGRNSVLGKIDTAMRGAADTLTFGAADEIAAGLNTGFGYLGDYDKELASQRRTDAADSENRMGYRLGGQLGGGLVGGAGLVKAGLSPTAAAINAGWRLPGVMVASGAEGLALGGLQGFGSGEGIEDRLNQAETGAKFGLVVGALAPAVVARASKAAQKVISPFTTSPERTAAVSVLEREGVPLTAGQKVGSKKLRYAESVLGGERAAQIIDDQGRAFTDAAMRKAGGSGLADPDNLAALKSKLGSGFDYLSKRNSVRVDQALVDDINRAADEYARVLPVEQKKIFKSLADDIAARFKAGKGTMKGTDYQTIRSRLTRMAQNYRQRDGEFADAIRGLRNALDNGMERSINPVDQGAWAQLRRQYGNYKVLNKAALGGGEDAGIGIISPARLRMAASSGNRDGFATGASDFTKLSKAGQAVMSALPDSGTASRTSMQNLGMNMSSLVGAGAGATYGSQDGGGLTGALQGALAGFVAPRAVGRLLMSKSGQRYLANQLLRSGAMTPEMRALVNAVLTYSGSAATGRLAP
jgi:hypothetical protein